MANNTTVIKVKAVLSQFRVGEQARYRLVTESSEKIDESEFIRLASVKAQKDPVQARFWADIYRKVMFEELMKNNTVDMGDFYAKLHVGGSLAAANQQPTKEGNPVKARIYSKGALADLVGAFEVVNDTLTVGATLYDVQQDGAGETNLLTADNTRIVATGKYVRMDETRTDNGVWLESLEGVKVKDAVVTYSDAATVYFKFATLPADGKYRLVIATRNAADPDAYTLDLLKRVVYVKKEA